MPPDHVKRVFLSSVALGLESYRDAVREAINGLDGYKCVRMEEFGARDEASEIVCVKAVKSCEIFVGIMGPRFGSCPPGSLRSFTQIAYEIAVLRHLPRLMFVAPEDFLIPANLVETEECRQRQARFRQQVVIDNQVASFADAQDLAGRVTQAIHNRRALVVENPPEDGALQTSLLFPYVVSAAGFDTGISVSNAGSDPFGTVGKFGTCTFHYYGIMADGAAVPWKQTSKAVPPGQVLTYVMSSGSTDWGLDGRAAGLIGYVIVECNFPFAHGFAFIQALGAGALTPGVNNSYLGTVVKSDRSTG